ncbi:MAG: hypothetical protein WC824_07705 [Bacteroidota bacterium]|jgi:DNA polymerase I-like protein with 3'-5' exonuclease and polymerase domains
MANESKDIHLETAKAIFGKEPLTPEEVKEFRKAGKIVNFGLPPGAPIEWKDPKSPVLSRERSEAMRKSFDETYGEIKRFWGSVDFAKSEKRISEDRDMTFFREAYGGKKST